jgi:hypothetical protein
MDKTCKTCRWWGKEVANDAMEFFVGMRQCECPNTPAMLGIDHDRMEDVQSGEVATDPDFGCIHHEEQVQGN